MISIYISDKMQYLNMFNFH